MEVLNTAFFFVTDLIVSIQGFFIAQAWNIGRYVLVIALATTAINYAVTGQGLKENIIKIAKAVVFFVLVMGFYPRLVGTITEYAFRWGHDSVYVYIAPHLQEAREAAVTDSLAAPPEARTSFLRRLIRSEGFNPTADTDPMRFFSTMIQRRQVGETSYVVVAPAASLGVVLLVAGQIMDYARTEGGVRNLWASLSGAIVGFAVMLIGIFAVLEYLMAFLEFMLVAGVGVILFPLSLWEGTKFLAEKLIGAIIGFFIKMLFCNITMFLMLFGFTFILRGFAANGGFSGQPDEILSVLFLSLLFFYLCRSGPGLAQSLLSGVPSLSTAGAIGAAATALKAGATAAGMFKSGAGSLASGGAKAVFAGGGMISQAMGAANAAKTLGGSAGVTAGAFMNSMGSSAKTAMLAGGGNLVRSLLGNGGGGGRGGSINRHDNLQQHLNKTDASGNREKMSECITGRYSAGQERGLDYMHKQEQKQNAKKQQ